MSDYIVTYDEDGNVKHKYIPTRDADGVGAFEDTDGDGTYTLPNDANGIAVPAVNNTNHVEEEDDLQAAITNADAGETIVIDDGPNGRHDVSSTVVVDTSVTLVFRNKLVPTGDFPVMKTLANVNIVGRGVDNNCFQDADNNLTLDATDLVQFKAKVFTQGIVGADLAGNGDACFAFVQDDAEGSDNLNQSQWRLSAQRPGRDGVRMENIGASASNLNAMRNCWCVCNLNAGARHGLNVIDGKRNVISGLTSGGDGKAFEETSDGANLYHWDWEGVSNPTGQINSNLWVLTSQGWYTKQYTGNATVGIETNVIDVGGNTITLPDPPLSPFPGARVSIYDGSGDWTNNPVTVQDEAAGASGGGSFPFSGSTNYGQLHFIGNENGGWQPALGGR